MTNLPSQFLIVNHEGVFRGQLYFEEVVGLESLLQKFAANRLVGLRNVCRHPNGMIHAFLHSKEGQPILVLDAYSGSMSLLTHYQGVTVKDEKWVSPRYFPGDKTFELGCEFDFSIWANAGFRLYIAINLFRGQLNLWTTYKGQNYRAPFGNVFEDSRLCMGGHQEEALLENFRANVVAAGWADCFSSLIGELSRTPWNGDAIRTSWNVPLRSLLRFSPDTLQMLPPLEPDRIAELGIMADSQIAEITKLLLA